MSRLCLLVVTVLALIDWQMARCYFSWKLTKSRRALFAVFCVKNFTETKESQIGYFHENSRKLD